MLDEVVAGNSRYARETFRTIYPGIALWNTKLKRQNSKIRTSCFNLRKLFICWTFLLFYHLDLSENGGSPQIHWLIIIVPLRWAMEISVASRCPGCLKPWFEDGNTQVFLLLPFWIRRTGGLSFPVFPVRISIGINVEASAPKPWEIFAGCHWKIWKWDT